jgi:hypothetical protein
VIDFQGANLWAQVEEPFVPAFISVILSNTDCLHPTLDNMILTTVQEDGTVNFMGRLPREGIETENWDLFEPLQ